MANHVSANSLCLLNLKIKWIIIIWLIVRSVNDFCLLNLKMSMYYGNYVQLCENVNGLCLFEI